MTHIPTLFPGETVLSGSADLATDRFEVDVPGRSQDEPGHLVVPAANASTTFAEFQEAMIRSVAQAANLPYEFLVSGNRICISCGCRQTDVGFLPCGH